MTDKEAIAAVRNGVRCITSTTLKSFKCDPKDCRCQGPQRTVACDFTTDVIECINCGEQRLARCNFEDECS